MYQLAYQIRTLAPLVISLKYGEINTVNTERYIPGTTVLGMLAWRYKKSATGSDADFRRFFLEGGITFTNGWFTQKNKYEENIAYFPPPVSFRKSKTNEDDVYNILFANEDFDEQTIAVESFISTEEKMRSQPKLELHHHHERDRDRGSPAEDRLFTYEAISPGQIFHGKLLGDKEYLQKLFDNCGKQWTGWIGKSRNSQYGKIEFTFDEIKALESMNLANESNGKILLTMLSHTLIYNKLGFPTTCIHELQRYLCGAKIRQAALTSRFIENFVGVWRFKKPSETGFHAGSSFLLDIKQTDMDALSNLQATGLGERIHEGFGQIKFEKPEKEFEAFHLAQYVAEPQFEKPAIGLPDRSRSIVTAIIDEEIHNRVGILAAEKLQEFSDEKLKLLSGSIVAKIEQFLKSGKNDIKKFRDNINACKDIAKDQLDRCRTKEITLKEFFLKYDVKLKKIMNREDMETINSICDEIGYQTELNDNILTYIYFGTFLSLMKKRIKSLQKEN